MAYHGIEDFFVLVFIFLSPHFWSFSDPSILKRAWDFQVIFCRKMHLDTLPVCCKIFQLQSFNIMHVNCLHQILDCSESNFICTVTFVIRLVHVFPTGVPSCLPRNLLCRYPKVFVQSFILNRHMTVNCMCFFYLLWSVISF